jgi:AraC-like DNA-binding protein
LRESQTAHPLLSSALRRLHESVERGESLLEIEQGVAESTTRLLELCSESPVRSTWLGRNHPAVRKARAYLEEHFAETVSLDGLAREVGVSKYHLVRTFTESVGSSPHRYQVLLRLCAAQRRMEAGDSVRDAAAATGFADEPHLCRTFRTWLGISPGSWSRGRR